MAKSQHVTAGTPTAPPSASFHNALVDIVNRVGDRGSLPLGAAETVYVRNNTEDSIPRFGILSVGGVIKSIEDDGLVEVQNCRIFEGWEPDPDNPNPFAISLQEIPAGLVGPCLINSGFTPVIVDMADENDTHCFCGDSTEHLRSGTSGPWRILYSEVIDEEADPDLYWAIVAYVGEGISGDPVPQEQTPTYVLQADLPDTDDATNLPTTFEVRRPFGSGSATASGIAARLVSCFGYSRLPGGTPQYTHYLVCDSSVDVIDGMTRLAGSNILTYVDGDEVRIPSGGTARYAVVWVEIVNHGDVNEFKRVYLMRHSPSATGGP